MGVVGVLPLHPVNNQSVSTKPKIGSNSFFVLAIVISIPGEKL